MSKVDVKKLCFGFPNKGFYFSQQLNQIIIVSVANVTSSRLLYFHKILQKNLIINCFMCEPAAISVLYESGR